MYNGKKSEKLFSGGLSVQLLGRNAPIDFEKLNGFGRIGPAARNFLFSKKKTSSEGEMARRNLVCSHTTHNHTTYLQDTTQHQRPHRGSTKAHT